MPRQLLKRYMPSPERIQRNKSLRFLGKILQDPNIWHITRHSVARAVATGLFVAMLPIPLQMLLSACIAIFIRGNLPISVGLVWLTNPITMPPVFFIQYKIGTLLLGAPERTMPMELSLSWLTTELQHIWQPMLLGSLLSGIVLAGLGYAGTLLYWRFWVSRNWQRRKMRRRRQS
ncbi:hypothetical protein BN1049_02120 [Pseudomonas saudimassiliensis]|uniref:DUF2062 domain-containing protein n=1 Tax=Pseudomonas saudimassiliensis TaxID=1461581 RepID=A0A078MJD3_9PSED|nr:DUF2062 domain-containing protein [Pseudomonas saudimassiliensis]CEA05507.1 hypothetical protein BN1049_02120 [Pseudomonas saudimassiliensis]CEF27174.1 hypothetical protein BN1049_02120 [Pseudomonas saudimassiliensis]